MNINDLYENRKNYYLSLSSTANGGLIFCLIAGVGAFAGGLAVDETRAWGAFLFNLFFFYTIALGGVVFGAMQDVVGAVWGRPIKRIHESFSTFLMPATILLIIFFAMIKFRLFGAGDVYVWIKDPSIIEHYYGKNIWLVENFMFGRDIFALVAILLLARWHMNLNVKRDLAFVEGDRKKAEELGLLAKKKLRFWSGPILFFYGSFFTLLAFDLTMSLEPLWFSTLWGGWSFAIMMQSLMATILLVLFWLKETPIGQVYGRQQFHDVGKMLHGFTAFFAYLTFAHVLTYWYGNVPEETEYFIHRLQGPWFYFVITIPFLAFGFPIFALIPKAAKWTAAATIPIALCVLLSQWLMALLVVMPPTTDGATWVFPWVELGLFLGFLGLFLKGIFSFGAKIPMVGLADPLLPEALGDAH